MIKTLKLAAFKTLLACYRTALRARSVEVAPTAIINKMPSVHRCKGSRIILHDQVTVNSNPRHNPLLLRPAHLRTLTPDAVIEMKANSGMSGSSIVCCTRVTIGEYTMIGPNTIIYDAKGHQYNPEIGWKGRIGRPGKPITIGNRCLIGMNCVVLKGVTIGDNCVISAGTVVTKDVPAGHLAQGNPMRFYPLPEHIRTLPDGSIVPLGTTEE